MQVRFIISSEPSLSSRAAIPLFATRSHRRSISVTVESLVIIDQKTPVIGASLLRGADLPVELGVLIDASNSQRYGLAGDIVKAMNQFVAEIIRGPEDRVFLLQFDRPVRALQPGLSGSRRPRKVLCGAVCYVIIVCSIPIH